MNWTPEQAKILKKMKNNGKTASTIGDYLGITRNAVIGKARRLKLGNWDSNRCQPHGPWKPKPQVVKIAAPKKEVARVPVPMVVPKVIKVSPEKEKATLEAMLTSRQRLQLIFEKAWANTAAMGSK